MTDKKTPLKTFCILTLSICSAQLFSCNKETQTDKCSPCDTNRREIESVTNWTGTLGYYNDIRKWAVNVAVPNTIDSIRTCILCTDIPDSLKTIGKVIIFSGEL